MTKKSKALLAGVMVVFAAACSSAPYNVYSSKDGESWLLVQEKASRELADAQIKSSCRLALWGPYSHSVKVVDIATAQSTVTKCADIHKR